MASTVHVGYDLLITSQKIAPANNVSTRVEEIEVNISNELTSDRFTKNLLKICILLQSHNFIAPKAFAKNNLQYLELKNSLVVQ